jgi:hypothetical protein
VAAQPLTVVAGDPLCSLSAQGIEPAALREQLDHTALELLKFLETST